MILMTFPQEEFLVVSTTAKHWISEAE